MDESEVPLDHACRLRPVLNLATGTYGSAPGSGSNVPQERPTIKVYDEQVDIETVEPEPKNKLRNLKKFGTQRKRLRSPSLSSETRDSADEDVSGSNERAEGDAQDREGGNMPTSGLAKENYSEITRIEPQQRLTPELTSISNPLSPLIDGTANTFRNVICLFDRTHTNHNPESRNPIPSPRCRQLAYVISERLNNGSDSVGIWDTRS